MIQPNDTETLTRLASMTDDGKFERLAMAVLCFAEHSYRGMVHTGINTSGRTVKDPLDGVFIDTSCNPPRYFLAEHTTDRNIERKWLNEPKRRGPKTVLGDVPKAIQWVEEKRQKHAGAPATLILTCNQHVDSDLSNRVAEKCNASNITLDIWDAARLSNFLDTDANGQWIRRKYLGITQERLSCDLLCGLASKSKDKHRDTLLGYVPEAAVTRTIEQRLLKHLEDDNTGLTLLQGESGYGKSVLAQQLLASWEEKGFGLWLPAGLVEQEQTLESALGKWLKQLSPGLEDGCGHVAIELARKQGRKLLVVVDDVNSASSPNRLIEKLAAWTSGQDEKDERIGKGGNASSSKFVVRTVCPIWPRHLSSLQEPMRKRLTDGAMTVGLFSESESIDYLQHAATGCGQLTRIEARAIAASLGYDPLLLFMWVERWKEGQGRSVAVASLIQDFMNDKMQPGHQLTKTDCWTTLENLADWMLVHRKLAPNWRDIRDIFKTDNTSLDALMYLSKSTSICGLEEVEGREVFRFKHDRLRDYMLAKRVADHLDLDDLDSDVLHEPFYAEIIGQGLLASSRLEEHLPSVMEANPLAGFEALRLAGHEPEERQRLVADACLSWLDNHQTRCLSLQEEIESKLSRTTGGYVLEIADKLRAHSPSVLIAKLRNGDVEKGLHLCNFMTPDVGAAWRDEAISDAMELHGSTIINKLQDLLRHPRLTHEGRVRSLRLAGHIAREELTSAIGDCWNQTSDQDRMKILADFLWAALRCLSDDDKSLSEMMNLWRSLSDEDTGGTSPRSAVGKYLRQALAIGIPENTRRFLIRQMDDDLRYRLIWTLSSSDHPDVVECVVRQFAILREQSLHKSRHFSGSVVLFYHAAGDRKKLRPESMTRLREIWENENESPWLRSDAFSLWANSYLGSPDCLRKVPKESLCYRNALMRRMLLGDTSTFPEVVSLLFDNGAVSWWFTFIPSCWSPEYKELVSSYLRDIAQSSNPQGHVLIETISEVLFRIPVLEAEELLLQHWDRLNEVAPFFQLALYLATPETLKLAQAVVDESENPSQLFIDLAWKYGFWETDRRPVQEKQIRELEPYLKFMDQKELSMIWEQALKLGLRRWTAEKVVPLFDSDHSQHVFTPERFLEALDNSVIWHRAAPDVLRAFEQGVPIIYPSNGFKPRTPMSLGGTFGPSWLPSPNDGIWKG